MEDFEHRTCVCWGLGNIHSKPRSIFHYWSSVFLIEWNYVMGPQQQSDRPDKAFLPEV